MLLLLLLVNGVGVAVAQLVGLPPDGLAIYTESALTLILIAIVSRLGWWREIGFDKPARRGQLWLFLPALALFIGNLSFGIYVTQVSTLLMLAWLAATSGFVEEVMFRGLVLRGFVARGEWVAVLVPAVIFGLAHAGNVLARSDPLYVVVQIVYALAVGFGFGAMALRGGLIWPLIIAHGLGNFVAFINSPGTGTGGQVNTQVLLLSVAYIFLFVGYGLYLMLRHPGPTSETRSPV